LELDPPAIEIVPENDAWNVLEIVRKNDPWSVLDIVEIDLGIDLGNDLGIDLGNALGIVGQSHSLIPVHHHPEDWDHGNPDTSAAL